MVNLFFDSLKNSTIVPLNPAPRRALPRFPTLAAWLARRAGLRTSSWLAPGLVSLWAERLFLTPPAPRFEDNELFDFIDARQDFVMHRGRRLATWRWGGRDAPAVLLIHGWGGRAAQMRPLVFPLLAAGYRVIAFDQPAHGLSEGNISSLPDFAEVIAAVAHYHGGVIGAIGHSMGGSALAFALSRGLRLDRVVLINAPSDMGRFARRFARLFSLPDTVRNRMQEAIEERYGVRWAEFEGTRLAARQTVPALLIHDRDDREVPVKQGEGVAAAWPGARLLRTRGLGHLRILSDQEVGRAAVNFVLGGTGHASAARAVLTEPAPLY